MRVILTIILYACCLSFLQAQYVLPDKIDGDWIAENKTETYDGKNLYGRINGGAELFLEYGFIQLGVREYTRANRKIVLEVYEMSDHLAALGIYLNRTNRESPFEEAEPRNSGNRYQLNAVKGRYYIQIFNPAGDEKHMPCMTALVNALSRSISGAPSPEIFDLLPEKGLIDGSEGLFRGEYALQPVFTFGPGDIFLQKNRYTGIFGKYDTEEKGSYTYLVIPYKDNAEARQAYENVSANLDSYLTILEEGENRLIFRDYADQYGMIESSSHLLKIYVHLGKPPSE